MKKIFFISAVALSLLAVGTSTNNKGSNNDELISRTQADTVAKMGASVKPLKSIILDIINGLRTVEVNQHSLFQQNLKKMRSILFCYLH